MPQVLVKIFCVVFSIGTQAVICFFVINLNCEFAARVHKVRFPIRIFDASSVGLYIFSIIACLIWVQTFYWLFERNTPKVRTFVSSAFRPS